MSGMDTGWPATGFRDTGEASRIAFMISQMIWGEVVKDCPLITKRQKATFGVDAGGFFLGGNLYLVGRIAQDISHLRA